MAALLLGLVLLVCAPLNAGSATQSAHFLYFNPDSIHNNLSGLKEGMDAFLSTQGFACSFQPFARFHDFDREARNDGPAFLFLPEWYLRQDGNEKRFKPFLIPVRQGASTYRKVLLVAADSALTAEKLTSTTIAMTPAGQAGLALLDEALFKRIGLRGKELNFITTAKDSDALFALALRQVKAALVSQDNLEHVGKINPRLLKTVKALAVSDPIPLPVLCYVEGAVPAAEVDRLREMLLAGKEGGKAAEIMEMLQIDAWRIPDAE
ncbi:PhnD/SsuA/transferrin family substrate-binding protein [Thiovibrio sp. JS02]